MKRLALSLALFLAPLFPATGLAFQGAEGCTSDCSSCHSLTTEEAGKLLNLEEVKVSDAPSKGIWQVEGTFRGQPVTVFLDFGKKYAFQTQQFIPVASIGKPPEELKHLDPKEIPLTGTMLLGKKSAKHKIIIFDDPDCPYCQKLHKELKEIIKKRKDIAFYIKLYPLPMHKDAYEKSKAILCENSLELLDNAFEGKPVPPAKCDTPEVGRNIELAKKLGVSGTPTFVFPDGKVHAGFLDGKGILETLEGKNPN